MQLIINVTLKIPSNIIYAYRISESNPKSQIETVK